MKTYIAIILLIIIVLFIAGTAFGAFNAVVNPFVFCLWIVVFAIAIFFLIKKNK